jgi:hypothetical protein
MDSTNVKYGIDEHKLRNINWNILEKSKLYHQTALSSELKKRCLLGSFHSGYWHTITRKIFEQKLQNLT